MVAKILSVEKRFWLPGQAPPSSHRGKVYQASKDALGYSDPAAAIVRDGINESEMSFPAVISTIDVDRVEDTMVPEGCQTENYRRNPVVFFGHQELALPIAYAVTRDSRQLQVAIEPGRRVVSRAFCVQRGKWAEEAAAIFELIAEGGLSGVSIGFNPIEWVNIENSWGRRYIAWDLLEWSVVGIPCNPYCEIVRSYLSSPKQHGLKQTIRKALEPLAAPLKAWAPGGLPGESEDPVSKKNKDKLKAIAKAKAAKKAAPANPAAPSVQDILQQAKDTAAAIQKALPPKANDDEETPPAGSAPATNEAPDDEEQPGGKGEGGADLGNLMGDLVRLIAQLQEMVNPPPAPTPPVPAAAASATEAGDEEEAEEPVVPPVDATETGDEEEEDDEEETEEVLDRYRSGKPRTKRLGDAVSGVCRDATEFLVEHADQENLTRTQKAACKAHAQALAALLEDVADDDGETPPTDDGKALDLDAIGAALKDLNGKLAGSQGRLDEAVYSITGQKVS